MRKFIDIINEGVKTSDIDQSKIADVSDLIEALVPGIDNGEAWAKAEAAVEQQAVTLYYHKRQPSRELIYNQLMELSTPDGERITNLDEVVDKVCELLGID